MTESVSDRIKRHEGCRLSPYKDSEGIWTVGYGRNLESVPFTQAEVDFMFLTDLNRARKAAETFPEYAALDNVRAGVVVEMIFQMGRAGVSRFKRFWAATGAQDWNRAADEMLDSKWAKQTPERAQELAEIFRNG